jgi:hypothetical protein
VFLQIFNFINARKVNGESDLFSGLLSNIPFLLIEVFIITTQVLLIEFGGKFADTTSLTTEQWFACVGIGSTSMIVGKLNSQKKYFFLANLEIFGSILSIVKESSCVMVTFCFYFEENFAIVCRLATSKDDGFLQAEVELLKIDV